MSIQVPANVLKWAQEADSQLWPVLIALAYYESSFDPGAIGDNGTSFGLLQFHQGGGLGDGHAVSDLLNGAYNMRLGAQYIRGRLAQGASLWDALQPWSTRPQAISLLGQIEREGVEGAGPIPPIDGGNPDNPGSLSIPWWTWVAVAGVGILFLLD